VTTRIGLCAARDATVRSEDTCHVSE
jgi:hypothetical protein